MSFFSTRLRLSSYMVCVLNRTDQKQKYGLGCNGTTGRMPRWGGCWALLSEKFMDEIVFTCCPKFITPLSPGLYFYLYNPFAYGTPTNFCTWQKPAAAEAKAEATIGICEPPFGLVKDKNHTSEQTDQLDLLPSSSSPPHTPPQPMQKWAPAQWLVLWLFLWAVCIMLVLPIFMSWPTVRV